MNLNTDYNEFVKLLKSFSQIDLDLYKEVQMKRRLNTFRDKYGYGTLVEMYRAMTKNETLYHDFLDKMTINVTEFFRNLEMWKTLEKEILPSILKGNSAPKVWSAACSTGEEPYTLSMILSKYIDKRSINIHATDIDKNVLEKAKVGAYMSHSIRNMPPEYRDKYFTQKDGMYYIADMIKQTVRFEKQNLLHDKFDKNFDLIVCRNVVIYFTEEAKEDLYRKFADALKPGGYFFIGSTEQVYSPKKYGLQSVGSFLYQKI